MHVTRDILVGRIPEWAVINYISDREGQDRGKAVGLWDCAFPSQWHWWREPAGVGLDLRLGSRFRGSRPSRRRRLHPQRHSSGYQLPKEIETMGL